MSHGWLLVNILALLSMVYWPFECECNYSLRMYSTVQCLSERTTSLNVTCDLRFNGTTKPFQAWSLVWFMNGSRIRLARVYVVNNNTLRSQVTVRQAGIVTCRSTTGLLQKGFKQRSMRVYLSPVPVTRLARKPVYTMLKENSPDVIIISWPSHDTANRYSLAYRWHDDIFEQPWHTVDSSSGRLSCAAGVACTATFEVRGNIWTNVSFYILTTNNEKCNARSQTWRYCVAIHYSEATQSEHVVVFVPPTPSYLHVTTSHRVVELRWQPPVHNSFSYTYNCSTRFSGGRTLNDHVSKLALSDKDISGYRPYARCLFCIRLSWYVHGAFSLPRCNWTRLHEELPLAGPNITCTPKSCPTSDDGRMRNLTLTWRLPTEETWNGRLTKVVVDYASRNSSREKTLRNLRSSNGSVQVTLNMSRDYVISMKACNAVGCGNHGNVIEVIALATVTKEEATASRFATVLIVVCSCLLIALCFGFALFLCCRRNRDSVVGSRLPELDNPADREYSEAENKIETFDKLEIIHPNENQFDQKPTQTPRF